MAFYRALNERLTSGRLAFGAYLGVPPKRGGLACGSIFGIDPEPPFAHSGRCRTAQGEEDEAATDPRPAAFSYMSPSPRGSCPSARKSGFDGRADHGCAAGKPRRAAALICPDGGQLAGAGPRGALDD